MSILATCLSHENCAASLLTKNLFYSAVCTKAHSRRKALGLHVCGMSVNGAGQTVLKI